MVNSRPYRRHSPAGSGLKSVPDTKTGNPRSLRLSTQLFGILNHRFREARGRARVPVSPRRRPAVSQEREAGHQGARRSVRIHDLWRTFATVAESLEPPAYTIKRLMNHHAGDIIVDYPQIHMDRLLKPMQGIADHIVNRRCSNSASMENGQKLLACTNRLTE